MATVREAVIDFFRDRGMTTVFGNPGSTEMSMLNRFPGDFRYVLGLQEAVVTGMADGYAQASGETALVNLHTAPGVGNAMGAIVNAAANRTPMLVTAGQQVRAMMTLEALLTHVDPTVLPRPAVKWAYEPPRAQDVPAALARAAHIAETPPRGPVFVSLPMDDLDAELDEADAVKAGQATHRALSLRTGPPPEAVAGLAHRLGEARKPVLVTGSELDDDEGWAAAVKLAEHRRLPVWTAPAEGRAGFPQNHPNFQGFLIPGIAALAQQLAGHDLIIVAGAPVFRYYPYMPGPYLPDGAELVLLTDDPGAAARAPVGSAIVGDVRLALRELRSRVEEADGKGPEPRPASAESQGATDSNAVFKALAEAAPDDAIWVNESPSNIPQFQDQVRIARPRSYLFAAGGGLGFGLPAAVGAQLARPDRRVINVMGDGSMHYAIPSLWTAARHDVPVTVVVLANAEYAILKWFGAFEKVTDIPGMDLPGLDIVSIATGYGVDARRVADPGELADVVSKPADAPRLIEIPIARSDQ